MKRRNEWKWLGLFALTIVFALPAAAQGGRLPPCKDPRAVARYLGLSEEQRDAWRELREAEREAADPILDAIEPLREDLADLLDEASPEACAVGGIVVEIDAKRDDLRALHEEYVADFEALLTPEQLERWERLEAHCRRGDRSADEP